MSEEIFFRPSVIQCEEGVLTADIYNLCYTLLSRSPLGCVFVPMRDMQYMAVIDKQEIIFVDSLAYQVIDGKGGKVITTAWQFPVNKDRNSLSEPVTCTFIYYHPQAKANHLRLHSSFRKAIVQLDTRYRENMMPSRQAKVIPIKPRR